MTVLLPLLLASGIESATFRYEPADGEAHVPEIYRVAARTAPYELALFREMPSSGFTISRLTFPSPFVSPHPENNVVHAEYYRPVGDGPFPAVIVLDITGGDQSLSRFFSRYLAQNRIAALFVQMAYYGPRRPNGSRLRLMSPDIRQTTRAVAQTVQDCRVAAAWLRSRPEIAADRVGIMGTSLGSFLACLTAEMEPRIDRVALLLGGGGLVDAYYDHPKAAVIKVIYEAAGGTKDQVKELIAPIDPITRASNLRGRSVLMLCASRDEVVPPSAGRALWEELGRPKIVWYDAGHYTAGLYVFHALTLLKDHFAAE